MARLLPPWLMNRYVKLWDAFKTEKFTFKDAQDTLKGDSRIASLCITELAKYGWLRSERNPTNRKTKLYQLWDGAELLDEILQDEEKKLRDKIEALKKRVQS